MFPLTFSLNEAFRRRELALQQMAVMKATTLSLFYGAFRGAGGGHYRSGDGVGRGFRGGYGAAAGPLCLLPPSDACSFSLALCISCLSPSRLGLAHQDGVLVSVNGL